MPSGCGDAGSARIRCGPGKIYDPTTHSCVGMSLETSNLNLSKSNINRFGGNAGGHGPSVHIAVSDPGMPPDDPCQYIVKDGATWKICNGVWTQM
jgi:hypothetical protein